MRIVTLGIKTMPALAGADRVAERLLQAMPEHSHTVYVVRGKSGDSGREASWEYVELPALKGKHTRALSYFFLSAVHFALRGQADVVHVHNSEFGLFCPILRLKPGVRVVGTFHGCHSGPVEREKWSRAARAFLRWSERCFVRWCHELTTVAPLSGALESANVTQIPNGIDAWHPPDTPADLPQDFPAFTSGQCLLFAAGRLDQTKGLHHLLRAYRTVASDRQLVAVADFTHDGGYADEIRAMAAKDSRVLLYPKLLNREALFRLVAESQLFVFPSEFEAMSMMLLEAIACRKLVVCSDIPGNLAVVGADYPYLFHTESAASLATVLSRALEEPADSAVARELFARVEGRFRWGEIALKYEAIYAGAA